LEVDICIGRKCTDEITGKIVAFALSFAIDYGTTKGLGRHDIEIKPQWLPSLRKSEYAFTILYVSNDSRQHHRYINTYFAA
jgi:hypothetical protein